MQISQKLLFTCLILLLLTACAASQPVVLRLATTSSTYDSGLLDAILPEFEQQYNASVDIVAVGTGQAITLGENGDADLILVHARAREDAFVAGGFGTRRYDLMYNDFILVGPVDDPAGVRGFALASEALARIAEAGATFASRGDDSGTHSRELQLWQAAGIQPDHESGWYNALGQTMGTTLQFANESMAYTLTDRGTYLALKDGLGDLEIMVGGASITENADPNLLNPYGVIPVSPDLHEGIAAGLAQKFVEWLTSIEVQEMIAGYGTEKFGQPLFFPDSQAWRESDS